MKNITEDNKSGFTIVELTLTMAFIGMLLIAIAVITTNILAIYQKGTALKAVNNTGRDLIDSFSNSLVGSSSLNITNECSKIKPGVEACRTDNGFRGFTYNAYRDPSSGKQLYGVFCTGSYSYIWNTEYTLQNNDAPGLTLKYKSIGDTPETRTLGGPGNRITLARVLDSRRRVCSATVRNNYTSIFPDTTEIDVTHYLDDDDKVLQLEGPEDGLLDSNDVDLVLYELTVFPYSNDAGSGNNFYAGTFILGTRRGDINIQSSSDFCKNSSSSFYGDASETAGSTGNLGAEFNYCAVNKFNFAVRSAGE